MLDHISVSRLNDPNQEVQRLASNWKSNNNSWASNLKPSAGITKCTIHQDFAMESSLLFSLPLMAKKLCHMRCVSAQVDAVSGRKCIRNHVFQPNETGWILKLNRNKLSRIGWNQGTFGLSTFTKKSHLNVAGKQNKHIDSSWGDNISGHVTRSTWARRLLPQRLHSLRPTQDPSEKHTSSENRIHFQRCPTLPRVQTHLREISSLFSRGIDSLSWNPKKQITVLVFKPFLGKPRLQMLKSIILKAGSDLRIHFCT